jgi:HSP20 family molecular chaperone IbpA
MIMTQTTDIAVAKNTQGSNVSNDARRSSQVQAPSRPRSTVMPHMDIYETADGVTLIADLPGVSADRLQIRTESDRLFIEGEARIDVPEGFTILHTELREPVYQRSFSLSREMDASRISAQLKDGVLTLTIPRSEAAKPRKIEVRTA